MATMTKERAPTRTNATAAELRQRADAARREANRAADEAEAKVKAAWRDANADDWVRKLKAEAVLPALRVTAAELRAAAIEADAAWRGTMTAHQVERAQHHRPLIEAARAKRNDLLDQARRAQETLWALGQAAIADDGRGAFDLSMCFGPLGGCDVRHCEYDAFREREHRAEQAREKTS